MLLLRLSLSAVGLAATASAQLYEVHLLDADGVFVQDFPARLGSDGTVVGIGTFTVNGNQQASLITAAGATIHLPALPGNEWARAEDHGVGGITVGTCTDLDSPPVSTGVYWQGGQVHLVQDLVQSGPPYPLESALGINDAGWMIGTAPDPNYTYSVRGWLLRDGVLTDLGSLDGEDSLWPYELNESGTVVGAGEVDGSHAFSWKNGVLTDLHATAGVVGMFSQAYDVNENDVVVGSAEIGAPFTQRACIWREGEILYLGTLAIGESWAHGVNDHVDVVGHSNHRAFLWRLGVMRDLNELIPADSGWLLRWATDIDNQGRIVGHGLFGGLLRGFRLEPVCRSCTRYCTSTANSTGQAAVVATLGWESLSANYMTMSAGPAPAGQAGLFFYGAQQTQLPLGDGFLCVAGGPGGLFRLPVTVVGGDQQLVHGFEFDALPEGGEIFAGATWNFQAWFRDPAAGQSGSNTSDAVTVTFIP